MLARGTARPQTNSSCQRLSKKPPRPRFALLGAGCTTRLHVQPNISQSGLPSRGGYGLVRVRNWCGRVRKWCVIGRREGVEAVGLAPQAADQPQAGKRQAN